MNFSKNNWHYINHMPVLNQEILINPELSHACELCSRKEHMHRMIEVRSVLHAAWACCRTGKSFKMLKREGRGGGVSRIT